MDIKEATSLFRYYQQSNRRKRTRESYRFLLQRLEFLLGTRELDSIKPDEIYHFLESILGESAKSTRRLRYAQLKAFFNFIIEKCYPDLRNPCHAPLLSKTYRMPRQVPRTILEKELVDEMIYNTKDPRNRLMLELQARCGLRCQHQSSLSPFCRNKMSLFHRNKMSSFCRYRVSFSASSSGFGSRALVDRPRMPAFRFSLSR